MWPDKISVEIFQQFKTLLKVYGSGKFLKAFSALNKHPARNGIKKFKMYDFQISILLLEDRPYLHRGKRYVVRVGKNPLNMIWFIKLLHQVVHWGHVI